MADNDADDPMIGLIARIAEHRAQGLELPVNPAAITAVEFATMRAEVGRLKARVAALDVRIVALEDRPTADRGWIACADRLPDLVAEYGRFGREYLIFVGGGMDVARMRIVDGRLDVWIDDSDQFWPPEAVSHWMELPPPPGGA